MIIRSKTGRGNPAPTNLAQSSISFGIIHLEDDIHILIIALVVSAFFSSAETVFVTFDKLKLLVWKEDKSIFIRAVRFFFPHTNRYIITSLVGISIANVAFSSLMAVYLTRTGIAPGWIIVISTFIVLIFAEIIPKVLALSLNAVLIKPFALLLFLTYIIFYPVVASLGFFFKLLFPHSEHSIQPYINREMMRRLIQSSEAEIHPQDADLAESVLTFASSKMREVMTPRTDIVGVSVETGIEDVTRVVVESGHSKIVVYDGDIDHIIGYIHAYDLIDTTEKLRDIVRPAEFVSEFTLVIEGLKTLRNKVTNLLVVLDEYGGVDGIVTIEDIAEEISGAIEDEHDLPVFRFKELSVGRYMISGRAELDDLNREFELNFEKKEGVETFGGWIVTKLGRIPKKGEKIDISGLRIEILSADSVVVKMTRVELLE